MKGAAQVHHLGVSVGYLGLDDQEVKVAARVRAVARMGAEQDHAYRRGRSLGRRASGTLDIGVCIH
jgi:hypothetical protein